MFGLPREEDQAGFIRMNVEAVLPAPGGNGSERPFHGSTDAVEVYPFAQDDHVVRVGLCKKPAVTV